MGIRISEKHGINPTIPICFWCGKEKNEIALLGKLKGDVAAPMQMVIDYGPCDECKKGMNQGITIIQVTEQPHNLNQPPLQEGIYPTGKWSVVREDYITRAFGETVAKKILMDRRCFMDETTWKNLGFPL